MVRLEKTIICLDIGNSSVHLGIYETGTLVFQDRQNTSSFVKSPHEILKKCLSLEYPIYLLFRSTCSRKNFIRCSKVL